MAFSVIASAKNAARGVGSTAAITVDISGLTLADDDCLFAILGSGDDVGTGWACTADGWAQLGSASTTTGNDASFGVMRHYIENAASEPSSLTFQRIGNTGTDNFAVIIIQCRGVDNTVPSENAAVEFTVSNDPTPNNVDIETFSDNDAILVAHLYSDAATVSGSPTLGPPSGYTGIDSITYSDGTNLQGIFMQAAYLADAGTAGAKTIGSWTTGGSPASSVESYTAAIAIRQVGASLPDGVYHDRASVSHAVTGSISQASFTWDHNPRNVPSGILIYVVNMNNASNIVSSVTYGGVDVPHVIGGDAVDATTEPGNVSMYFLGSDIPTDDPATIVVNRTNNSNELMAYCVSVYSTTGETDITGGVIQQENAAFAETNIDDGSPSEGVSLRYACAFYGGSAPPPSGPNSILRSSFDTGAITSGLTSEANSGNGSRPVGFVAATDDRAISYIAVIPVATATPTSTTIAEISLAWHGTPSERTNHSIKIRARTTSGSTGVIKAALYEGANNRSGDLTSGTLTNSLADYSLDITDALTENITDYSNLSIRFWGYDSAGNALVFEVADVRLHLPTSSEIQPKITSVAELSLESYGTPLERTSHSIEVRARTTSGSTGVIKAALYEGVINRSGDLTSGTLTNSLANYSLAITDETASAITDYSNLSVKFWGYDSNGNSLVFEVAEIYLSLPEAGVTTHYGVVARATIFTKAIAGTKKTFGQVALPIIFAKAVSGQRKTFGVIAVPITFTKAVIGQRKTFGVIAVPITFTKAVIGQRKTFGVIAVPIMFTKAVIGQRKTFGVIAVPITFTKAVLGSKKTFGVIAVPIAFTKSVLGSKKTFGQLVAPFTFTKSVSGVRTTFGQFVAPFTFIKVVSGVRATFGQLVAPFTFTKSVSGVRIALGQITASFIFTKSVMGTKKTFGQVATSFTFTKAIVGIKKTFGQLVTPFVFVKNVSGFKTTFGQIVFPITASIATAGIRLSNTLYGAVTSVIIFSKDVAGYRTTFSQIIFPVTFSTTSTPFIFVKDIVGRRTTFVRLYFLSLLVLLQRVFVLAIHCMERLHL